MLLSTDGGVTSLLEACFGATVVVQPLSNAVDRRLPGVRDLELEPGEPILRRRVVLRLAPSGRPLLCAGSDVALERFDKRARQALLLGTVPIGRVLRQAALDTRRQLLRVAVDRATTADAAQLGLRRDVPLFERTYRILAADGPLAVVTERIPESIFDPAPAVAAA
jgi:chorismate-pyruvate lyase